MIMNDKMTRREIREAAFIILFQMQLNDGTSAEETAETTVEAYDMAMNSAVMKIVNGVTENMDKLDEIISKYSKTRAISRISKINLTILRIGLYEMDFDGNVPKKVAINEAVELSKMYADKQDSGFINGILGSYYKDCGDKD